MFTKTNCVIILVVVSICTNLDLASGIELPSTHGNLTYGEFIQDKDFFVSPGSVYGSCHDIRTHGDVFKAKCTFVMENNKRLDTAEHSRTCDYNLYTRVNPQEYLILKRIVAISKSKAVVIFESYDTFRYFVLHFDEFCNGYRVDTDQDTKSMVFSPQEDKFELISTQKYYQCKNNKRCRLIINDHGRIEERTHGWIYNDESELMAVVATPSQKRIVVDKYGGFIRVYDTDDSGLFSLIREYPNEEYWEGYDDRRLVSITYRLVSVCSKMNSNLICGQFDLHGNRKFETELQYAKLLKVHNVPNGGLFLVLDGCSTTDSNICINSDYFFVTKIDAIGKEIRTLRVTKGTRIFPEKMHFYENEDEKLCLSHVFNNWRNDQPIDIDTICFSEQDFYEQS